MWNFTARFLFNFDIFVQNKISMSFITIFIFSFSRLESIPDSWKFIYLGLLLLYSYHCFLDQQNIDVGNFLKNEEKGKLTTVFSSLIVEPLFELFS